MKKTFFTLLFTFVFTVSAVYAEVYQFNTTHHTVFTTKGNMLNVQVNGNIINFSEGGIATYNNYGAVNAVYHWVLQEGNPYDFSGTLRYSNENYCNSLCIGWNTDGCYFIDYYNNGVVTNTDLTLNCRPHRNKQKPFFDRSPGFWAP
ncbi:MAG: hypothetical protein GY795_00095 [Desulfobacterales bacterium]|nr:hypothetical protein [Desulfobacterales bacterium]